MSVCSVELPIDGQAALHLRPFQEIAERAAQFQATVTISRGTKTGDAKSIFDMRELAAQKGPVTLEADGVDANRAIRTLSRIIRKAVRKALKEERDAQRGRDRGAV